MFDVLLETLGTLSGVVPQEKTPLARDEVLLDTVQRLLAVFDLPDPAALDALANRHQGLAAIQEGRRLRQAIPASPAGISRFRL